MQSALYKNNLIRLAALLLVLVLALCALPQTAKATGTINVFHDTGGVAALIEGINYGTINAVPKEGYIFDYWVAENDIYPEYDGIFYGAQLSVPNPPAASTTKFTAHFRLIDNPQFGVQVQVDPANPLRGAVSGLKYATDDRTEVNTTLTATPAEGYAFSHWLLDGGTTFHDQSMQVTSPPGELYTYTAYFTPLTDANGVFTAVDGSGSATGDKLYSPEAGIGQQTVLQAFPRSGEWVFSHWELSRDGAGKTQVSTANPYTVNVVEHKDEYTAVFKLKADANGVFTLTAGNGTVTGDKLYDPGVGPGQQTTLQAFPLSGEWVFSHWELNRDGAGRTQVSAANPYTVKVEDHKDEYTAVFTATAGRNGVFTLTDGNGTATGDKLYDPSGGPGQQTTLQAFPTSDEWVFSHWALSRDGAAGTQVSTANPYTVKVEDHKDEYTAVFKREADGNGVYTQVKLVDSSGAVITGFPGTTSGDTARTVNGAKVNQTTLQAFPTNKQYIFHHWELKRDNIDPARQVSTANPYTVKVEDHNDLYTAVFMPASSSSSQGPVTPGKTGIVDSLRDVWRRFTTPNYGTTRFSLFAAARDMVSRIFPRYAEADPHAGGSAAVSNMEEALAAKEAAAERGDTPVLPDGVLVSSKGEHFPTGRIGAEAYADSAADTVTRRFGSLYTYEILQAVRVHAPIGPEDGARSMVWRNTGAAFKDRLLLIQIMPSGAQNIITPIADEEGTLTFALQAATDCEFLLLRVSIKANGK